ncbi:MAG TPA: serine hydrolase domain-containing protein, partial [Ilumatobacteraceae bacterium]
MPTNTTTTTMPATTTTRPVPTTTTHPPPTHVVDPSLPSLTAAFNSLTTGNLAVEVTVIRDHKKVFARASGTGPSGRAVTPESPMVLASVSKLITATTIARLVEAGSITLDEPVPWDSMGIAHDPAWNDVTVRELLTHTSGMPIAQKSWLNLPGSCAIPLTAALAAPPTPKRGTWVYSNGNYCALGLLIENVTGVSRDAAAQALVFDPIGVIGPHLTTTGLLQNDG